jgi:type I restriction enzyme, S subunit
VTVVAQKQLRHVFAVTSGATPDSGNAEYWDGDILWATPEDVSSLDSYWLRDTRRKITRAGYESCGTATAPPGSIVLTKRAPIGQVAVLAEEACSNQGCFLLTPRKETDTRFFYYWLSAQTARLQVLGRGSTFMELSTDELKSLNIPHRPLPQQRAIADYLDRETARLDALVAAKQRVLGLLAEKRRALITRAVTRGLDQGVLLRDSGIPWLGEIPAHWEVVALRFLVDISGGATPDTGKPELWDGDIPWVSPKDMKYEEIEDAEDHISPAALSGSALRLIDPGAVLIVVRGMILAHSFPTAVTTQRVTINQDMKALRCRSSVEPYFLRAFFWGMKSHIVSLADSSAHGTRKLESEVLGRLEVCVPPLEEQRVIVAHITTNTSRLDALRSATERTIALLKERRAALITAAVTGQVDVESAT